MILCCSTFCNYSLYYVSDFFIINIVLSQARYLTVNETIWNANLYTLNKSKQTSLSRHHSHAYLSHWSKMFPTSAELCQSLIWNKIRRPCHRPEFIPYISVAVKPLVEVLLLLPGWVVSYSPAQGYIYRVEGYVKTRHCFFHCLIHHVIASKTIYFHFSSSESQASDKVW